MLALIAGIWLLLSIIVGVYAVKKSLNGVDYFLLSFFLSPVVGFATLTVRETRAYCWPTEGVLPPALRLKRASASRYARY